MMRSATWASALAGAVLLASGCPGNSKCNCDNGSGLDGGAGMQAGAGGGSGAGGAGGGSGGQGSGGNGADAASGELQWYQTCGGPLCMTEEIYDDPNIPNCSADQTKGSPCMQRDQTCDGVATCRAMYICTDMDPTMGPGGCPISRARYKKDIAYLNEQQLRDYHDQIMSLPLASYRYKSAPEVPQLGFIIDDIEPSVAVAGDHVNMYGYLSMAVAAIKVQQEQIENLQHELERLRTQVAAAPAPMCTAAQ